MRRGDRLTHVNGNSLTSQVGWRTFAAIQPGQRVRWAYTRGCTHARGHDDGAAPPRRRPWPHSHPRLRWPPASGCATRGTVGGSAVEVRGAPANVTTDPRTGETVIRSADITVRIRPERENR